MAKSSKGSPLKPAGMYNKNNPGVSRDKHVGKGSVNNGAERKGTAPTPKTLGPRTA